MGRAAFMRVPVSEANDLNFLLGFNIIVEYLNNYLLSSHQKQLRLQ